MSIPFYTSVRDYSNYKSEYDEAISNILERGDFILGQEVRIFEEEVADYLGVKHAVGVASGSDALTLGADILGFKNGAEVLTPTFTFFASTSCIVRTGGTPVFVDMDEDTFNIDVADAERRLTKNTKGILPVHLFLQPANMQKIVDLASDNGLKVLEDSAEAFGMKSLVNDEWKSAGTIGDIGVYSFFPTKTLGAYGDAGLMVTNDDELHDKIKYYRVHGASKKYHYEYIGYNSRLDTIQAAILRVKLKRISESIELRKKHALQYIKQLSNVSEVRIPEVQTDAQEVYYVFNILAEKRDGLQETLKKAGIGTSIYYPKPLHMQECFSYLGYKEGDFPVAERVSKNILALPMYPELTENEISQICEVIKKYYA